VNGARPTRLGELDGVRSRREDVRVADVGDYAFSQSWTDEPRRLQLLEQHLDPLTVRRLGRCEIARGASCLEIGGGRGSIARWLAERVGPEGRVTVTDLQLGLLEQLRAGNIDVLRHDVRRDTFTPGSFDLVHARAVLMHLPDEIAVLHKLVSWLRPAGWLVLEEPDFGMWSQDADELWAKHPQAWHRAFPSGALARGRSLLKQIHQLGLIDIGADAQTDIVSAGTPLAEFYRLSMAAIGPPAVATGALTRREAADLVERPRRADFLACGFVHIGVWGRLPSAQ
jgi:2-polyprenyl-3-methyl-5-hydroxy-6-metoxy-1,4-benzoquinol methylase